MSIIYNLLVTTCLLLSFNKKITSETCLIAFFLSTRKYMLFLYLLGKYTNNICNYELLFRLFYNYPPQKKILYHYYCSSNAACMLRIKPAYLARFTADPLNNLR